MVLLENECIPKPKPVPPSVKFQFDDDTILKTKGF